MDVNASLCCDLLKDGYLHSFEDLFNILRENAAEIEAKVVAEMLRSAERKLNRAEYEESFMKFMDLGTYFQDRKLFKHAAHFFEKCRLIAESKSKKTRLLREAATVRIDIRRVAAI